jgi:hypothetical protein
MKQDTYLDAGLRMGMNTANPSADAARVTCDCMKRSENIARAQAADVAASRAACAAIKAIAEIDLSPEVCAQIAAVLANRVANSSWSHFAAVEDVLAELDEAHDTLDAIGEERNA